MPEYEVKNVKTFRGREGQGFNCSLYRDKKRVAFVIDNGCGDEYKFEWLDSKAPKVEVESNRYNVTEPVKCKCTPEEAMLLKHIKGKTIEHYGMTMEHNTDTYVEGLVEDFELKKKCKKKTIFILTNGEMYESNTPFSEVVRVRIKRQYGDELKEFINERYV